MFVPTSSPRKQNMKANLHADRRSVQNAHDLFAAGERQRVRSLPLPARRLARRLGMPSTTALVIAEAAGFSLQQEAGR